MRVQSKSAETSRKGLNDMVNREELTSTTEYGTLQARCPINRCRYNRILTVSAPVIHVLLLLLDVNQCRNRSKHDSLTAGLGIVMRAQDVKPRDRISILGRNGRFFCSRNRSDQLLGPHILAFSGHLGFVRGGEAVGYEDEHSISICYRS